MILNYGIFGEWRYGVGILILNKEILIAGMRKSLAVCLKTNQCREASMSTHGRKMESVFFPLDNLVEWKTPMHLDGNRPIAWETMRFGMLKQVGKIFRTPAFRAIKT